MSTKKVNAIKQHPKKNIQINTEDWTRSSTRKTQKQESSSTSPSHVPVTKVVTFPSWPFLTTVGYI